MATAYEARLHPTIFDPATCVDQGLVAVAKGRAAETHRLYYELHGAREAKKRVVFIMGLNNSSAAWSNQVAHFGKKPEYCVLVFDNRGVGNSDTGARGRYKTSEMAKDVVELLDHVGWTEPRSISVVGVSMGGMISQELSLLIPERIATLVLTSTKAGDRFDLPPCKGLYMFLRLFTGTVISAEGAINLIAEGLFPDAYLSAPDPQSPGCTRRQTVRKELLERYRLARRQPFSGRFGQLGAAMGHSLSKGRLEDIMKGIPTVAVITGDEDALINPRRSLELHEMLPGSELVVVKGAGHALPSQIAGEYNQRLERWIEQGLQAGA